MDTSEIIKKSEAERSICISTGDLIMKKFFGLTVLLVAALFVSCNFNNSNQKGSVDFSIPVGEIIALRNEIQEEPVTEKEDPDFSDEPEIENEYGETFGFLVQLKGNKGYHQIRYEYFDDTKREDLEEATFPFSFENLPADQQYKVMIDVFVEEQNPSGDEKESHALLIFSGDKDNIIVSAGETTREKLELDYADELSYSNFDIVVKYKDGNDVKSKTFELNSPENIPLVFARNEKTEADVTSWTYYFREKNENELEEYGNSYSDYENQNPEDWKELVYLGFKLKDDSHYDGFDFVGQKEINNKEDESSTTEDIKFVFDHDNTCAVLDYLEDNNYPFNLSVYAELTVNGTTIKKSMWFPLISVSTISFAEKEEGEGTLTLSIPGIELENSDATAGAGSTDMMYTYLVQVRGMSGSYYAAQTKTVNAQDLKEGQAFTFEGIVPGSNYKAMVDIFSQSGKAEGTAATGKSLLTYAGDETVYISGDTTSIEVTAEATSVQSYSDFYLQITHEEGDSIIPYTEAIKTPYDFGLMFAKCNVGTEKVEKYKYYYRPKKSADEEIPSSGFEKENPEDWTEIKDFYFGLKEDSHYRKFTFVQTIQNGDALDYVDLIFDDNNLFKVTDYMQGNSYIFNYPLSATLVFGEDSTFDVSLWTPQVTFADISFAQPFTETQFGEITIQESKLSFTPWNVQEDNTSGQEGKTRYMTTVPLDDILDGKHLSDGDSVVFILALTGLLEDGSDFSSLLIGNNEKQFYYQLQEDNWETTYANDHKGLFKNNNCINFDTRQKGDYTFVMPLNLIQDAQDYRNLQLFFDCSAGTETEFENLEFYSTIQYTIFPATENVFVFGVGKNYDKITDETNQEYNSESNKAKPDYRYEVNIPLRDSNGNPLELAGGDTVNVYLQGKIRNYNVDGFADILEDKTFYAELYDNAEYDGSSFHALSIDKLDEETVNPDTKKYLSLGSDGYLANSGKFVFSPIAAPYVSKTDADFKNDFRFQCHTPCVSPSTLLVITDYSLTNEVNP